MRKTLQGLIPYKVASEQADVIRLDNNEAYTSLLSYIDFSELEQTLLNRYPDKSTEALIEAYSKFSGYPAGNILAGNGSDECITLISQYSLDPGDSVIVLEPDFSMYEKNARVMGAKVATIQLNDDFSLPLEKIKADIQSLKPKLLFLSNPNNPTGRLYGKEEIEALIQSMNQAGGILVLDEAYMDFAGESAFAKKVIDYDNLIILRTASKALGMAALRLGFIIANDRIIEGITAVKPPYNVNTVSAQIGTQLLKKPELLDQFLIMQLAQIAELEEIMKEFTGRVPGSILYPSSTNFILMRTERAKDIADFLYERKIKIRLFDNGSLEAVRVSAGTVEEHSKLKEALMNWSDNHASSVK
ncbi:pyridoxal phosphate-dependent aminotransferase [Siminovitchia fordii]|uniref:Histidinol-phosphate aminotransferase n=1 Tax=Siminovitchia fordii TaxID=254759 RepID=A0ABQ4K512_9BACI|nr:histidinol-phosphate transaminase [Siminovitchia fordii]GIN20819.1 histidinol-phosphate aminotransferase [Siminovitchia fordii]